ncbi:hypothetical protein ABEB36_013350 [Hypothenemus hampei]|uniref:Uncharacterized protein n=1 Tax=Hypothenemus hampei TaxID=57062 RepID=A0ABD1E7R3_HYPHA
MVPQPRLIILFLCQVPNFRYFKAGSPSRNWIINPKTGHRGLPPQYPTRRRGSTTTPMSSLAIVTNATVVLPNRSRSLDGLLDSEPTTKLATAAAENEKKETLEPSPSDEAMVVAERYQDQDCPTQTVSIAEQTASDLNRLKTKSVDDIWEMVDDHSALDKVSNDSSSDSNEAKNRKSFMNRCVNKVRSLIRK